MSDHVIDNAQKVENFKQEVIEELIDIKERVEAVRAKIDDNRGSHENFNGFLCGQTGEYLDCFDSQIEKMNARLAKDQEYWAERAACSEESKNRQNEALLQAMQKFQLEVSAQLFGNPPVVAPAFDLKKFPLSDMECFGNGDGGNTDFRWPT